MFYLLFHTFECKSSHIIKYDKGKWGMSVNLCRFAKNRIQDIEIWGFSISILQDSQKKTTVLERHETVKTGENMAESAYFFVILQQNCNV